MAKLPIILLTGFLGAGKTTVLNNLLKTPALADSAVLINEFGDIALDHHLVESVSGSTVVLDSGCVCCTLRGALSGTLRTLFWQRHDKKIPRFQRVIVETTGLADPAPIIHELMSHPHILQHYRLAGVITCVDAVFGADQLDRQSEAYKQAGVADRLLITKTDIADPASLNALSARLQTMNPGAGIHQTALGSVDPQVILAATEYDPRSKSFDVQKWLKAETYRQVAVKPRIGMSKRLLAAEPDPNRHGAHIQSFCLTFEQPLPWEGLITGLEMLALVRGEQLLRIKGIVDAEGCDKPRVIHAVQHMLFPSADLSHWPDADRTSRLVFIVRGIDADFVAQTLNHFIEAARNASREEAVS